MTPLELLCRLMAEGERRGGPYKERVLYISTFWGETIEFGGEWWRGQLFPQDGETVSDLIQRLPPVLQSMAHEIMGEL